jgi:hypothetical protein
MSIEQACEQVQVARKVWFGYAQAGTRTGHIAGSFCDLCPIREAGTRKRGQLLAAELCIVEQSVLLRLHVPNRLQPLLEGKDGVASLGPPSGFAWEVALTLIRHNSTQPEIPFFCANILLSKVPGALAFILRPAHDRTSAQGAL